MVLLLETCCGYAAAAIACVAFGSFAVPIKTAAVQQRKVDPLGEYDSVGCSKPPIAYYK